MTDGPITRWEVWREDRGWVHNHIEDGHVDDSDHPTPTFAIQMTAWAGQRWRKSFGRLDDNYVATFEVPVNHGFLAPAHTLAGGSVGRVVTLQLRYGRDCYLCGRELIDGATLTKTPTVLPVDFPTIDHVIPQSRLGPNALWNLRLACPKCNSDKGALPLEQVNPEAWVVFVHEAGKHLRRHLRAQEGVESGARVQRPPQYSTKRPARITDGTVRSPDWEVPESEVNGRGIRVSTEDAP